MMVCKYGTPPAAASMAFAKYTRFVVAPTREKMVEKLKEALAEYEQPERLTRGMTDEQYMERADDRDDEGCVFMMELAARLGSCDSDDEFRGLRTSEQVDLCEEAREFMLKALGKPAEKAP